jgi:hypothetical protein
VFSESYRSKSLNPYRPKSCNSAITRCTCSCSCYIHLPYPLDILSETNFLSLSACAVKRQRDLKSVTVRLSLDFILGVKICTLDREDRVS